MESRTRRNRHFQIERLEGRDIPSRLIGLLAAPVESQSFDRSGHEVQGVAQLDGVRGGFAGHTGDVVDIIAILK